MSSFESDPQPVAERSRPGGSWTLLFVLLAVGCVYLALVIGRQQFGMFSDEEAGGQHPAVGERLPYLKLEPLTGDSKAVTLEDVRGKVVLLNFWGTWCPPCREEFPHLAELAGTLKNDPDFILLAVSCGSGKDDHPEELKDATEAFLARQHSRLPTYCDPSAHMRRNLPLAVQETFGYPTTILLDGEARIRGVWVGYDKGVTEQMERAVTRLLKSGTD